MAAPAVVLMPPSRRKLDLAAHPKPGECGLCVRSYAKATERYVDEFGYTTHLCRYHYVALVGGLRRIAARRLARSRYTPGVGASAVHPAVQEQVIAVLAEALAERLLAAEDTEPVEKGRA